MKTKTLLFSTFTLALVLNISNVLAQQNHSTDSPDKKSNVSKAVNYSYRLFNAPDNSLGYDIFSNGKLIFHEPSLKLTADQGKIIFAKRDQAEKAAAMSMVKIQNGLPAALTKPELEYISR